MKRIKQLVAGIAMLTIPVLMVACATVPPQAQVKSAALAKAGDTVRLFYGANKQAKEEFCIDQVVPVYRYEGTSYASTQKMEVGKVKVTKVLGEHYLEGVVVDGRIKNGDIASQTSSACLIRLPGTEE